MTTSPLPPDVVELLNGEVLESKVGITIALIAAQSDGWPRVALLSVGEVYAPSPSELRVALYPNSGTTRALAASGKALLSLVLDGNVHRIRAELTRVPSPGGAGMAYFAGSVAATDVDKVGYARVTSGITFELPDDEPVLRRWRQEISNLREAR